jgi:hypothetical protein
LQNRPGAEAGAVVAAAPELVAGPAAASPKK